MRELELQNRFLGEASKRIPNVRCFRRQVLSIEIQPGVRVKSGIVGQSDVQAIVKRTGRVIEIEIKSLHGRLSEAQERWRDWCAGWGVAWMLLKPMKGETAEQTVDRWVKVLEAEVMR